MSQRIFITPEASRDLDNLFDYIAEANPDNALRFFDAARKTFATLAKMPGMGSPYSVESPRLKGLRKWAVKGFERYLIFYLSQDGLLTVVRILYAGRDLPSILETVDPTE